MKYSDAFVSDCLAIRRQSPLIHNVTNYVAMNFSANALLAVGASPIMSSEPSEAADIVSASDALVINIGCLEKRQEEAILTAVRTASGQGKPWVLDPAGVAASAFRKDFTRELVAGFRPSVIRGNASEIACLCGESDVPIRGVDSVLDGRDALPSAIRFAGRSGSVVCVSGKVDLITDGHTVISVENGSPLMASVTAMGCCASALVGAFLSVDRDCLAATFGAVSLLCVSGEDAASVSKGPGSFNVNLLDALACADPVKYSQRIIYEQESA